MLGGWVLGGCSVGAEAGGQLAWAWVARRLPPDCPAPPTHTHTPTHTRPPTHRPPCARWHLWEKHVEVGGHPIPGALFDFGLFFFHNAKELVARGSGPYFYLPKMQVGGRAGGWVGGGGGGAGGRRGVWLVCVEVGRGA